MENNNFKPTNDGKIILTVDDGSIEVVIQNKFKQILGSFPFNPSDFNIIYRYNERVDDFEGIADPLLNYDINADGTVDEKNDAALTALKECEKKLSELFDYVLGGEASAVLFSKTNAFAIMKDGSFYCEFAYKIMGDFISNQFGEATRRFNKRMARIEHYTKHGVKTGKHAGGSTKPQPQKGGKK
jgi:hypothetical protein